MAEIEIRNYDELYRCESVEQVHLTLNSLNVPSDSAKREVFLKQFMGITKSFGCGESNSDEDYAVAREELVFMNEQRKSGRLK
jgi:hypothetical protein